MFTLFKKKNKCSLILKAGHWHWYHSEGWVKVPKDYIFERVYVCDHAMNENEIKEAYKKFQKEMPKKL